MITAALICSIPAIWVLAQTIVRNHRTAPTITVGNVQLIDG
jgi:hypothetical protein